MAGRGKDGSEIVHLHFELRLVEGAAELRFELVGRTIGLQQVRPEGNYWQTGRKNRKKSQPAVNQPKRSPAKIQARFPLV